MLLAECLNSTVAVVEVGVQHIAQGYEVIPLSSTIFKNIK